MRAFTIIVQPDPGHEGHLATIPGLPGFSATGTTVEECVERAHRVIGLFVDAVDGVGPPADAAGLAGHGTATFEAEAEALDALRRGMAALRTVESALEDEITRSDEPSSRPLRRAHGALLRARHALVEEERLAVERTPDHASV